MDRLRSFADKIAVESEPGLTSTQLLLTNGGLARQSPPEISTEADY
jgi:hypothetical protein